MGHDVISYESSTCMTDWMPLFFILICKAYQEYVFMPVFFLTEHWFIFKFFIDLFINFNQMPIHVNEYLQSGLLRKVAWDTCCYWHNKRKKKKRKSIKVHGQADCELTTFIFMHVYCVKEEKMLCIRINYIRFNK